MKKPRKPFSFYVFVIFAVAFVIGAFAFVGSQQTTILSVRGALTQSKADTRAATANADKLYNQLLRHNITPTAQNPTDVVGTPGAAGATGATGPGASDFQVFQQVTVVCSSTILCKGADGPPGAAGTNGADGAQGPQGPAGTNGADGRGISTVTCVTEPDLTTALRFTFTDQTPQDVSASCIP
jgi:hypothetical protein